MSQQPEEETGGLAEVPDQVADPVLEPTPLDEDTSLPDDGLPGAGPLLAEVAELDETGPAA